MSVRKLHVLASPPGFDDRPASKSLPSPLHLFSYLRTSSMLNFREAPKENGTMSTSILHTTVVVQIGSKEFAIQSKRDVSRKS